MDFAQSGTRAQKAEGEYKHDRVEGLCSEWYEDGQKNE